MKLYLDLVVLLNFLVDFLLLVGTNRLAGFPVGTGRAAAAAAVGGLYGGACLIPGFRFLGNLLWRMVSLGIMGAMAFGIGPSTLRRCALFVFLSMALGGIAMGLGSGNFWSLVIAAGGVALLCAIGFRGKAEPKHYIPVELRQGEKAVRFLALHDTGNTLRDPLTGESVLVAGEQTAWKLAGLTREALLDPVGTIGKHPGLRLIPYRAVGVEHGMLLGMHVRQAKIGNQKRSVLVAFAPKGLDGFGECEGLIGGAL